MHSPRKKYGGKKPSQLAFEHNDLPPSPPSAQDATEDIKISTEEMALRMKKRSRYALAVLPPSIHPGAGPEENLVSENMRVKRWKRQQKKSIDSVQESTMNIPHLHGCSENIPKNSSQPSLTQQITVSRSSVHQGEHRPRPMSLKQKENRIKITQSLIPARSMGERFKLSKHQQDSSHPFDSKHLSMVLGTPFKQRHAQVIPLSDKNTRSNVVAQTTRCEDAGSDYRVSIAAPLEVETPNPFKTALHTGTNFSLPSNIFLSRLTVGGHTSPFIPPEASTPKPLPLHPAQTFEQSSSTFSCLVTLTRHKERTALKHYDGQAMDATKSNVQEEEDMVIEDTDSDVTPQTSTFSGILQINSHVSNKVLPNQSPIPYFQPQLSSPIPTPDPTQRSRRKDSLFGSEIWSVSVPERYASLSRTTQHHTLSHQSAENISDHPRRKQHLALRQDSMVSVPVSYSFPDDYIFTTAARTSIPSYDETLTRRGTDMSMSSLAPNTRPMSEEPSSSDMSIDSVASPTAALSDIEDTLMVSTDISCYESMRSSRLEAPSIRFTVDRRVSINDFDNCVFSGCSHVPSSVSYVRLAQPSPMHTSSASSASSPESAHRNKSMDKASSSRTRKYLQTPSERISLSEVTEANPQGKPVLPLFTPLSKRPRISPPLRPRLDMPLYQTYDAKHIARSASLPPSPVAQHAVLPQPTVSPSSSSPDPLDFISPKPRLAQLDALTPRFSTPRREHRNRMLNRTLTPLDSQESSPDPLQLIPRPDLRFVPDYELNDEQ